ncbi:MAG TPA: hypothetical protein VF297_12370 [Pyrinomonadaceae bacterium]
MLPLNSILVGSRRRARALACFGAVAFVLAFACRDAAATTGKQDIGDGDARQAERILEKLRLLHEAADTGDAGAYRKLVSKFYPDLFVKVAELRAGDLSTDVSTAVFLAEQLGRTWPASGVAADCRGERPDIYQPLCGGLRDGTARELLLAKSRLHARWAEALLRDRRGEANAETVHALTEMTAARANDKLLAALVIKTLRPLEALTSNSDVEFAEALREAETLLAWMPRSPTFYQLLSAREAYRDGRWWHDKARGAKSLVVSARNFAPDPLEAMRLNAEQVSAAATANWLSAAKHTRLAEQSLLRAER